jgi:hypothetical protein
MLIFSMTAVTRDVIVLVKLGIGVVSVAVSYIKANLSLLFGS